MTLLRRLPPETAHRMAIRLLSLGGGHLFRHPACHPVLKTRFAGLEMPNPIGIAAGFDKNAEIAGALLDLGFGFAEVGTVTPYPQAGNPKPRLFRLDADGAVINRMGFNNDGADRVADRLAALRGRRRPLPGPIGVNLGCNRNCADPIADYRFGVNRFADLADYLVINISSPNTPGLRDLQAADRLRRVLDAAVTARDRQRNVPIFVKIAPDLDQRALETMIAPILESGIDGVIATNTTTERPACLTSPDRLQAGGVSGRPLAPISAALQQQLAKALAGALPIIGVGGIADADGAYDRIKNGAAAVQVYTALVFHGPALLREMVDGLSDLLSRDGFESIADAVGVRGHQVDAA